MRVPGFTAQASLRPVGEFYKAAANRKLVTRSPLILPQICGCVAWGPHGCIMSTCYHNLW
jgi:hypothetical protein